MAKSDEKPAYLKKMEAELGCQRQAVAEAEKVLEREKGKLDGIELALSTYLADYGA